MSYSNGASVQFVQPGTTTNSQGTLTTGSFQVDNHWIQDPYDWWHGYYHAYPTYVYPTYITEDKVTKAFRVIQTLMKMNIINSKLSVKTFIELVNDIARYL